MRITFFGHIRKRMKLENLVISTEMKDSKRGGGRSREKMTEEMT